jgi:hypothetical protein
MTTFGVDCHSGKMGTQCLRFDPEIPQFQLTVNISAVITAQSSLCLPDKSSLAAIQLLWVNDGPIS